MEGRGVTNYSADKPSVAYSTRTTEFDDALVQRGIVTLEQAFMAKGASQEEAERLAALKRREQNGTQVETVDDNMANKKQTESDDDESDDEFLAQYRRRRLQVLQKSRGPFGDVIPISRPDWTREVNDDSNKAWVVVTLTSHDVERTGCVETAVHKLAPKFPNVKFVTIPSTAAIADWPNENLPTLFAYRNGKLQKEFIRLERTITADELEWDLAECNILETDLDERPPLYNGREVHSSRVCNSVFGGTMAQLETRRYDESDDDDYDDVD